MESINKRLVSLALVSVLTSGIPTAARAVDEPLAIYETPEGTIEYVVEEGDTLGGIALKLFGNAAYYEQLALYNNMEDPNKLYVGDIIEIPDTLPIVTNNEVQYVTPIIYDEDTTYIVQSGDTLGCIANRMYGVNDQLTVDRLATYNDLCDPNRISVEQVLFIPCIEKLNTIIPNDYSEEYRRMNWLLEHPECNTPWENCYWLIFPEQSQENTCEHHIHHHHHHHCEHKLVLKP